MFHPLSLLFYVSSLCFICGRMAALFEMSFKCPQVGALFCSTNVKDVNYLKKKWPLRGAFAHPPALLAGFFVCVFQKV